MQSNAAISMDDARDITADQTAEVSKRIAWYLHNDPLIKLPLTKRTTGDQYQQLTLTPDQRMGDFMDFYFKIRGRSMTPLDAQTRARLMMEFAVKVMPAIISASVMAMQIGMPFNTQRCLTALAEEQGLTADVMAWFDDPEFNSKMKIMMQMGPQNAGKAAGGGGGNTMQNGQPGQVMSLPSPDQQSNIDAQGGANNMQSQMKQGDF
jgi:hypothetical protein